MHTAQIVWAAAMAGVWVIPSTAAEPMQPVEQTTLVRKYCAVCHTDATRNGGLTLERYDAAQPNPALAAMLLSKLQNGAMGAAGLGVPEPATRKAWVAATAAQAEGARSWTVLRTQGAVLNASIVRPVAPRNGGTDAPVYRLIVACDVSSHQGEIQLTWSPAAQTERTFSVSADGNAGIPHRLEGREEKMGNGAGLTSGLASTVLHTPLPEKILTVTGLFPGETVVFPLDELDRVDRRQLAVCLAAGTL